ncbi:MAG TPA: thioredoxin-like domain-containing protein [Oligoflexia bacterium]|nr:thioredoxin-like domain-containing protein [Oligoflexia bacterium]HMR24304.1 thioredoxin-like domain-containing protein [Oligoflexia bacterium]
MGVSLLWADNLRNILQTSLPKLQNYSNLTDKKIKNDVTTVVVFLSSRCPCSHGHISVLNTLAQDFSSVQFLGVHSNQDENDTQDALYFKNLNLSFPVFRDENAKLANEFGALKTPHVFVLNKSGGLVYEGGVDDSLMPDTAKKHYLRDTLTLIENGQNPKTQRTRTLGCEISR